jgi:hypothetical protein
MTSHHSDILLPRAAWNTALTRSRLIAFVPIALALIGIAAVFLGGISARTGETAATTLTEVDPVTTGSIATPDARRRALEMLDR